jgi:hypothetical protein
VNNFDTCDSIKKVACRRFSKQLLDIGDGKVTTDETGCIKLPTDSAQSLTQKMLSLTRYFPMYTDNTQIMSGWQKEQFKQQKMWTSTN